MALGRRALEALTQRCLQGGRPGASAARKLAAALQGSDRSDVLAGRLGRRRGGRLLEALSRHGEHEAADRVARLLLSDAELPIWGATANHYDLHGLSAAAGAALLRALLDGQRCRGDGHGGGGAEAMPALHFRGRLSSAHPLTVVTGYRGGTRLRSAVREVLREADPPFCEPRLLAGNAGRVVVPAEEVRRWLERRRGARGGGTPAA